MSKRFVNPALPGLLCLVLLIWQFNVAALAQAPAQSGLDAKGTPSSGTVVSGASTQSDLASKKVLILHSFENNQPAFLGTEKGLMNTLQSGGIPPLKQFFEFLNLRRFTGPEHRKLLVEEMRVRYGHQKIDMIITVYAEALEFVLKDCRDVLPDVPILAYTCRRGSICRKRTAGLSGISPKLISLVPLRLR